MAYFPTNLLMDYQRLRGDDLRGLIPGLGLENPMSQVLPKEFGSESYQDMGALMSTMSMLNATMGLRQMTAVQRSEQTLIAQLTAQNELLQLQVASLTTEKEKLAKDLESAEKKLKEMTSQAELRDEISGKKKRIRRTAREIAREFTCPSTTCGKSYGSEGSLHQHMRLKHPDLEIVKNTATLTRLRSIPMTGEEQPEEFNIKASSEKSAGAE